MYVGQYYFINVVNVSNKNDFLQYVGSERQNVWNGYSTINN